MTSYYTMKRMAVLIGVISILICLITWGMDLVGMVDPCVYCRTERTVIGLIGLILLLPPIRYLTRYFCFLFGFFGASTAAQQVILLLANQSYATIELPLAIFALIIIIGQMIFVTYWDKT